MAAPIVNISLMSMRRNVMPLYMKTCLACSSLEGRSHPQILSPPPSLLAVCDARRPKTTQKIHKARKKGRLLLKDQKRMAEKEEWTNDPNKRITGLLKRAGIKPGRKYAERSVTVMATEEFAQPYVPPEGDGKASTLSKEGAKQRIDRVRGIGVTQMSIRKIRQFEPEFQSSEFAWKAQQIYIDAHNHLQDFDKNKLHSLVTEKCYPEMVTGFRHKTIQWNFLESLEKPRVVHVRCSDLATKGNTFAQVTVRMHSKQMLAIYDRFGRLEVGNEDTPKDVLEYIVLEKHLMNAYGAWRLHGKIVPPWATHREPIVRTVVLPSEETPPESSEEEEATDVATTEDVAEVKTAQTSSSG